MKPSSRTIIAALFILVSEAAAQPVRFAIIADYGNASQSEEDVAALVQSWNSDFVITLGDNNYDNGSASTIDQNIGQYYHAFIFPYTGSYGQGDTVDRFFPALGNHDWVAAGAQPYLNYFTLPDNERYYDFVKGDVHFFVIDSDTHEPHGTSSGGIQGQWLQNKLANSTARWKVVYFHHPPYSSGTTHGSQTYMRWPFQQWGASIVLSGHEHNYERLVIGGFTYIVNGLGGRSRYNFGIPISGSLFRFNLDFGAQLGEADQDSMVLSFYSRTGALIDRYVLDPASPLLSSPVNGASSQPTTTTLEWSASTQFTTCRVQVATDALFTSLVLDNANVTSTSRTVGPLSIGETYFWRVRAISGSSIGAWSSIWSFTIAAGVTNQYPVQTGWNLVSLPLTVNDPRPGIVYPSSSSDLYTYTGSRYHIIDTMNYGVGYWLKFDTAQTVNITGLARMQDTILVQAGWNIIGISTNVDTGAIQQMPPGLIESPYYSYNSDYAADDTLESGKAYWVRAVSAGQLIMPALTSKKRPAIPSTNTH